MGAVMAGRVTAHGVEEDPSELRERATRMTLEPLADDPARSMGAIKRIAERLGPPRGPSPVGAPGRGAPAIRPDPTSSRVTLGGSRSWRRRSVSLVGQRDLDERLGFFRGGARPPVPLLCRYVKSKKDQFGPEPICVMLTSSCVKIAPSTACTARTRPPPPRARRDEVLKDEICTLHAENYSTLRVRKMHVVLNRPLVAERHGRRRCPLHGGAPHALGGAVGPRRPTRRAPHCVSSAPRTWRTATSRLGSLMSCGSPTSPTSERSRSGRTSLSS